MATQTAAPVKDNPKDHFRTMTPGKIMGLKQITDKNGKFKVFALDQSNSFKKAIRALNEKLGTPKDPTYEDVRDAKMIITTALSSMGTAVLLDVNYGLRQAINLGALARGVGLIGRVEASKDAGIAGEYEPGWSVAQIKKMGCSAVKLLVYMDVEDEAYTKGQLKFAKEIYDACIKEDILLMTEELSFPRKGEDKKTPAYVSRRPKNIIESAKLLGPITIGHGAKVGANSVVITDVPPHSTVVGNPGHPVRVEGRRPEGPDADWIHLPDPIAEAIKALSGRIADLERQVAEQSGTAQQPVAEVRPLRPVKGPNPAGG